MTTTRTCVSRHVWNPAKSLFRQDANARAKCTTIFCELETCPLREAGACMWVDLCCTRCPYGQITTETGFTRRARKFSRWIQDRKDEYPDVPHLTYPKMRMAVVGEYVYLPYAHMAMCEAVPFGEHAGFMCSGTRLLPMPEWTVENVLRLIDFRPRAMMGGEITSYQKEAAPLFLLHLREEDAVMWQQVTAARPELDVAPNHVGRKALLKTLISPIDWTVVYRSGQYPVEWNWDGQYVTTQSPNAYNNIWGEVKAESVEVRLVPSDDAEVEVLHNEWVNDETVFTT